MVIPGPQIPKPARPLSPAEREDSIQKRQRPTEVNTVLALAGGDNRLEISTLTDDQKALLTAKVNELLNMDKFGVVELVDRPQLQQVLSTRWVSKQRLDGSYKVRLVARGFEQTVNSDTDFYAGAPKLATLRVLLKHFTEIQLPWRLPQCTSLITDAKRLWFCVCGASTGSTAGLFQGMALQESFSRTQDLSLGLGYSQHTENHRHEIRHLISDPSTHVKKRAQRSDDSILLRHMDDVVGTGPEEHLRSDFKHMSPVCI